MSRLMAKHSEIVNHPSLSEYQEIYFGKIIDSLALINTEPEWYLNALMLGSDRKDVYDELPGSFLEKLERKVLKTVLAFRNIGKKARRQLHER